MERGLRPPLGRNEILTLHRVAPGLALTKDRAKKARRKKSGKP